MTNAAKITLAAAFAAAATWALSATPAAAVDFSCNEARQPAEHTICGSPRLAHLDETMARTYGKLWSVSGTRERIALRAAQVRFLDARNACRWNERCIRDAYLDQISVLDQKFAGVMGR